MALDYHDSYLGQLRKLVGKRKLISIGARAVLQKPDLSILFIKRSDNGDWALPAGSLELDESILECVKREVWEETGLTVEKAQPFAVYSEPRFAYSTAYGDPYQMFRLVFLVQAWSGELQTHTDETVDARFFAPNALPDLAELYRETLRDLEAYRRNGQFILK